MAERRSCRYADQVGVNASSKMLPKENDDGCFDLPELNCTVGIDIYPQ